MPLWILTKLSLIETDHEGKCFAATMCQSNEENLIFKRKKKLDFVQLHATYHSKQMKYSPLIIIDFATLGR